MKIKILVIVFGKNTNSFLSNLIAISYKEGYLLNTTKMILKRLTPFLITIFVIVLVIGLNEVYTTANMPYVDGARLYVNSKNTVFILIPYLLIPSLYGYIYYSDKKNDFHHYIGARVSIKNYRIKLLLITFISCFLLIFLAERITFYVAVQMKGNIMTPEALASYEKILGFVALGSPYGDSIIFSLWVAFSLSLYAVCGVVLSFNIKSFFIISTGGIIYKYLGDVVGSITGLFGYISLVPAESASGFPHIGIFPRIIAFSLFILFMALIHLIGSKKRRSELI